MSTGPLSNFTSFRHARPYARASSSPGQSEARGDSSQRNTFTRRAPAPGRRTHRAAARQPANSLHVTLSHKPPQHRGLPRPEGAPSRQTPDAVFAAASPRGRRTDDASRNNRARSLLVPRRPYPKRAPAPLPARARPAPARPSLNLAPKASSIAHRTASSALSKISRAFLRSSKKAARLQTLASLEDVVANRFAANFTSTVLLNFHGTRNFIRLARAASLLRLRGQI